MILFRDLPQDELNLLLFTRPQITVPAVSNDQPCSEAPPNPQVFAALRDSCAIAFGNSPSVTSNLDGHVTADTDLPGLETQIMMSLFPQLPHEPLNGF